ncbi:hypothetical protein F4821DRAFT_219424 [Hypoxylon rubiginosum]|uniref:Uncharacterized protein n=1 Tax=Hypoxylon rubiginosum TaxID=110542 RepID=A0ACC0CPC1_9PEZI|nr:hypothetical protein F4821DRAFT_219424 [Hypoxylon rubiginosum]
MGSRIYKKPILNDVDDEYTYYHDDGGSENPNLMYSYGGSANPMFTDGGSAPNTMFTDVTSFPIGGGWSDDAISSMSQDFQPNGYGLIYAGDFGTCTDIIPTANDSQVPYLVPVASAPVGDLAKAKCMTCGSILQKKSLNRHMRTVHPTDETLRYNCKCGLEDVRKDNHKRHVGNCKVASSELQYVCVCEHSCADKDDHLEHVKGCQHGPH